MKKTKIYCLLLLIVSFLGYYYFVKTKSINEKDLYGTWRLMELGREYPDIKVQNHYITFHEDGALELEYIISEGFTNSLDGTWRIEKPNFIIYTTNAVGGEAQKIKINLNGDSLYMHSDLQYLTDSTYIRKAK